MTSSQMQMRRLRLRRQEGSGGDLQLRPPLGDLKDSGVKLDPRAGIH